ncbi:TetR/AcrR family transcriptional regulator [Methanolacinia petrolearia]|uniref:TetR/AcrR family transcriptional regulator n=1 Tax=Methanolacinia petrolearia TaxID=54120 RepID=UPI003BA92D6B
MPKVVPGYKEEARKRILEAAFGLFWKKGFWATKMDDIAHELGISKGAIYTYFKDKKDLFTQATQHYRQEFESDMTHRMKKSEGQDIFEILFYLFTEYLKFGFILPFELMNLAVNDEEIKLFLVEDGKDDREYFIKYLTGIQNEGKIRNNIDIYEMADLIITLFYGLYMSMFLSEDIERAKRIWDNAVEKYK